MSMLLNDLDDQKLSKCINFLLENEGNIEILNIFSGILTDVITRIGKTNVPDVFDASDYLYTTDVVLVIKYTLLTEYSKGFLLGTISSVASQRWTIITSDTVEKTIITNYIGKNMHNTQSYTEYTNTYHLKYKDVADFLVAIDQTNKTAMKHGVFYDVILVSLNILTHSNKAD